MNPFIFPNFRVPFNYKYPSNVYPPKFNSDNNTKNFCSNKITYNTEKKEQDFNSCSSENSNSFFDFLGIKLASDDLIILGLLFFLYNEKIDDSYLFIALILLLLS